MSSKHVDGAPRKASASFGDSLGCSNFFQLSTYETQQGVSSSLSNSSISGCANPWGLSSNVCDWDSGPLLHALFNGDGLSVLHVFIS